MAQVPRLCTVTLASGNTNYVLLDLLQAQIDNTIARRCAILGIQADKDAGSAIYFVGNYDMSATNYGCSLVATQLYSIGTESNLILLDDVYVRCDTAGRLLHLLGDTLMAIVLLRPESIPGSGSSIIFPNPMTSGAVLFADGPASVGQDPTHFFWDDAADIFKLTDATFLMDTSSAVALTVGPNGLTNPTFQLVTNVASAATGLQVIGRAAGAGVSIEVLSSGSNDDLILTPKGTGIVRFSSTATPNVSDGAALGTGSLMWSDLFLASGAVVNFNNGNVTLTHSASVLTLGIAGNNLASFVVGGMNLTRTSGNLDLDLTTTTSGISTVASRGVSSTAYSTGNISSYGGGLRLQNLDSTAFNFTSILAQDSGGDIVGGIAFINESNTNNTGSVRFLTRPSGGALTTQWRLQPGGAFVPDTDNATVFGTAALRMATVNSVRYDSGANTGFSGTVAPPLTITVVGGIVTNVA